jgi:methionine sulfoxide reductase heme-binding subunit
VSRSAAQLTGLAHEGNPMAHLLAAGAATSSGPSPLWYATRATGVVALVLLTITVALGVAGVSRLESPRWPRVVTAGLHKNISLLVVAFVAVHVLTTVLDSFVSINPVAAIIPFASSYRPLWLSLGAIAFDMLLALVVTSLIRSRISYRAWKAVHWLAYASWPIALWHGLGTGTDTRLPWLLVLDAICVLLVAGALLWRLQLLAPGPGKATAVAATVALPVATLAFVLVGPLQHGWAKRAGTPIALLGPAANSAATASPAAATVPDGWSGFTGQARTALSGPGQEVITVTARTIGQDVRDLTIVLRGAPDGSGISMSSGSVRIAPANGGPAWAGPVTTLDGARLTAALGGPDDATEQVQLTLVILGHQATGTLLVHPAVSQ